MVTMGYQNIGGIGHKNVGIISLEMVTMVTRILVAIQ